MKKIVLSLLIASATLVAQANISVNFGTFTGGIVAPGGTEYADGYLGSGHIQLIWAASNAAYSSANAVGGAVDSGFLLLYSQPYVFNDDVFEGYVDESATLSYLEADYGNPGLASGWVYGRVFNAAIPDTSSFFANSAWVAVAGTDPLVTPIPQTPAGIDLVQGPAFIDLGSGFGVNPMNIQVIPEPSVMALMGLGGLLMAIRRRRMIA
jgi:hypothetical protein